jgi:uncharacterized RDD family membrane protein YckC
MANDVLDTVVAAETPEGILLELRPAGLSARFYAFLLDWLIRLVIAYAAGIGAILLGNFGTAFWLVLYFLLEWFYPVVFELSRAGATPGKSVVGLKVVMDNGLPITPAASFTRNLLRVADFLPFLFGAAIVSMLTARLGVSAIWPPRRSSCTNRRPPKVRSTVVPVTPAPCAHRSGGAVALRLARRR